MGCYVWRTPSGPDLTLYPPILTWCACGHMNAAHNKAGDCYLCELEPLMPWAVPDSAASAPPAPEPPEQGRKPRLAAKRRVQRRQRLAEAPYRYQKKVVDPERRRHWNMEQQAANRASMRRATRHRMKWTEEEIKVALDPRLSIQEAAALLGRTESGVRLKRHAERLDRDQWRQEGRRNAKPMNHKRRIPTP